MTGSGSDQLAVEARGLSRRFGSVVAVERIDLEIRRGEVFGLLGQNGAGKTTTLRMLCGLVPPSSGSAIVAGVDVWREPRRARAQLGYMDEEPIVYPYLNGREFLELVADIYERDVFLARLLTCSLPAWLVGLGVVALITGYGIARGASATYYLAGLAAVGLTVFATVSLLVALLSLVLRVVPARRARDVATLAAALIGAGIYVGWYGVIGDGRAGSASRPSIRPRSWEASSAGCRSPGRPAPWRRGRRGTPWVPQPGSGSHWRAPRSRSGWPGSATGRRSWSASGSTASARAVGERLPRRPAGDCAPGPGRLLALAAVLPAAAAAGVVAAVVAYGTRRLARTPLDG